MTCNKVRKYRATQIDTILYDCVYIQLYRAGENSCTENGLTGNGEQ